jgi:hypothetical protein
MSRPSKPRSASSLTAVEAKVARDDAVLAAAGKLVEYVHPPIERSVLSWRFFFLSR